MSESGVIIPVDSPLHSTLSRLAGDSRMVFCTGLPGVGKSLLINQLAHIGQARGRTIHLLQWDVCRQPFEASAEAQAAFPEIDGVTHPAVRTAVGIWARTAIAQWHKTHGDPKNLLIGEMSLVGDRLMSLLRRIDDPIEQTLADNKTKFVTPVPTHEVRRVIEASREERSSDPKHEREQSDAVPAVMRSLWEDLYRVAYDLKIIDRIPEVGKNGYDPDIYGGMFAALMKYRNHEILSIDTTFDTQGRSVYDLDIPVKELIPSAIDVEVCIAKVLEQYPTASELDQHVQQWYLV